MVSAKTDTEPAAAKRHGRKRAPTGSKGPSTTRTRAAEEADAIARLTSGPRRSIAMIAACPFPSHQGTQVFIRHLANSVAVAGHAVHLVTYGESEPLAATGLDSRVAWYRAPTPPVGLRSGPSVARLTADAVLLAATVKLLTERSIDILHVHNVEGLAIGSVAAQLTGVPLVYHAHTRLDVELPLYLRGTVGRFAAKLLGSAFEQLMPRSADAVICFDGEQAARFKRAGVSSARLHVVPLGLAMDELAPTVLRQPPPRQHRIIYAGNPDAYQNLELVRAAFGLLRARDPQVTLRLISNHARETFGALASDPGVEHTSFDNPEELGSAMRDGDLGLITRTLAVGAPVKALSYLSAGLPVVACATGASGLLAGFPQLCRLTEPTAEALAQAMTDTLAAPAATPAAFHEVRRAFEITDQLMAYEAVYTAALAINEA